MPPGSLTPEADTLVRFALDLREVRNRSRYRFTMSLAEATELEPQLLDEIFEGRRLPREQVLRRILLAFDEAPLAWLQRRDALEAALVVNSMQRAIADRTATRRRGILS